MKKQTHDFKGFDDYIEVFKAGTQTDSKGRTRSFSIADLDQVVANVEAGNPIPHVITHKEMYSPFAYAQTTRVKREGSSLYVKADKVEPQFEKLVADGRLFERSIRLVPSDTGWKLNHIAWLGAEPPAVAGLAPVEFSADDSFFDFSSDAYTPNILSRVMRRLRDFLIEQHGSETADKVLPDYEIESLSDHANDLRDENSDTALFSTHTKNTTKTEGDSMSEFTQAQLDEAVAKATKTAVDSVKADFAAKQQTAADALKAEKDKRLSAEFSQEINTLVAAGTLLPAQAEGMAEFMLTLSDDAGATFEFSAGEKGKEQTIKKSPRDYFMAFAKSIGQQIVLSEQAGGDVEQTSSDFSMPNASVNPDRLALHDKARDYMQKNPSVLYLDAIQIIERKEG